jgi:hypothetical protein
MAQVTGILCQVITGDVDGAGTDGRVYLGLGAGNFAWIQAPTTTSAVRGASTS